MMKIQMQEKKIRLPEDIHAYASKKVTKLERYFSARKQRLLSRSPLEKNRNNGADGPCGQYLFPAPVNRTPQYVRIHRRRGSAPSSAKSKRNKTRLSAVCGRMPMPERSICPTRLCPNRAGGGKNSHPRRKRPEAIRGRGI